MVKSRVGDRKHRADFAAKIQYAIEASGKSQTEIARHLGYENQNVISMFKSGKTRVPLPKVPVLARLLGLDVGDLLRDWFNAYEPEALPVIEAHFGRVGGAPPRSV